MSSRIIAVMALIGCSCLFGMAGIAESDLVSLDCVRPDLTIISPISASLWPAGSTQRIEWYAFDNHFDTHAMDIHYQVNGGSWIYIAHDLPNSGFYDWEIPDLQTSSAIIRITAKDRFGNMRQECSASFEITEAQPKAPENLSISIINDGDILLNWDAVTQNVYGNPCTPDGYRVYVSGAPGVFSLLGQTNQLSIIHHNAAADWNRRFYMVRAYRARGQEPAKPFPQELSR